MRHHQHKGLYIALKLGGAAVATAAAAAAAYKAYVLLKSKNEEKKRAYFIENGWPTPDMVTRGQSVYSRYDNHSKQASKFSDGS